MHLREMAPRILAVLAAGCVGIWFIWLVHEQTISRAIARRAEQYAEFREQAQVVTHELGESSSRSDVETKFSKIGWVMLYEPSSFGKRAQVLLIVRPYDTPLGKHEYYYLYGDGRTELKSIPGT
jgi:hypothetical protein